MAEVRFEHVTKSYTLGTNVITDLNLIVKDGEFLVLVGPSGCGKSTALRMIAGLETITDGDLFIGDRWVNDIAPKDRDIAMVFQNYALYPHMTVYDNLAFSLKLRHRRRQEIDQRVQKATQMLGIGEYLRRRPRELSGGQRQRVALGRALVREPQVFLLDEPLSNLDAKLRVQTRAEISRLHQAASITFVYVTHDQVEAMTMGDRIVVLDAGVVQQLGTPQELYDTPDNLFVAGFIGSPAMDFFRGRLVQVDGRVMIAVGEGSESKHLSVTGEAAARLAHLASTTGNPVTVGIRPEDVRLAAREGANTIDGTVEVVEHLGNELLVYLRVPGLLSTEDMHSQLAVVRLPAATRVRVGEAVALALDISKLHVFDPATTRRL